MSRSTHLAARAAAIGFAFAGLRAGSAEAQVGAPIAAATGSSRYSQPAVIAPSISGTIAIPILARRFLDDWTRASRDASALPQMQRLVGPARLLPRPRQIAYIQQAVARLIKWRSDTTQYGKHDYWASAAETLASGRGDAEDRAILKMQALRALGFSMRDLYFTLGRDSVGGAISVLIVRDGKNMLILDDTGGPPYSPAARPEFQPVLTFGYGASWVHRPLNVAIAAKSASQPKSSDGN